MLEAVEEQEAWVPVRARAASRGQKRRTSFPVKPVKPPVARRARAAWVLAAEAVEAQQRQVPGTVASARRLAEAEAC